MSTFLDRDEKVAPIDVSVIQKRQSARKGSIAAYVCAK